MNRPGRHFGPVAAALLALLAGAAPATEFALVPEFRQTLLANDNIRLAPDFVDNPGSYGAIADFRLAAIAAGELYSVEIKPRAEIQRYQGDSTRNRDNYFIDSTVTRVFQRSVFSLAMAASDVSTQTSELTDSGRFFSNSSRISWSIAPQWNYSATDKLTLGVNALYNDVDFENSGVSVFVDYLYTSFGGSATYAFSDRTSFIGSLSYSIFRTPETFGRTETKTWSFGLAHDFSDTANVSVSMGHQHSDIEFVGQQIGFDPSVGFILITAPDESSDGGSIVTVEGEKRFDRVRLAMDFRRSVQPSSEGVQSQTTVVRGRARYRWTRNLLLSGDFTYQERSSLNDLNLRLNQDLYVLKAGVSKTLNKRWRLETAYEHRRITRGNDIDSDYNRINLTLIYNGKPPSFPVIQ